MALPRMFLAAILAMGASSAGAAPPTQSIVLSCVAKSETGACVACGGAIGVSLKAPNAERVELRCPDLEKATKLGVTVRGVLRPDATPLGANSNALIGYGEASEPLAAGKTTDAKTFVPAKYSPSTDEAGVVAQIPYLLQWTSNLPAAGANVPWITLRQCNNSDAASPVPCFAVFDGYALLVVVSP